MNTQLDLFEGIDLVEKIRLCIAFLEHSRSLWKQRDRLFNRCIELGLFRNNVVSTITEQVSLFRTLFHSGFGNEVYLH